MEEQVDEFSINLELRQRLYPQTRHTRLLLETEEKEEQQDQEQKRQEAQAVLPRLIRL